MSSASTQASVTGRLRTISLAIIWWLPPALAATLVGAIGLEVGSIVPWEPFMLDLSIYRRAGEDILAGRDFYLTPEGSWPFIYPPFAALAAIPLAVMSWPLAALVWPGLNAALLMIIGHRFGISGWRLSVLITAAVVFVEPLRSTLAFGQINIVLMALVLLDAMPGSRLLGRRRGPLGWLIGVASGIKLTPAIFAVYHLLTGRWRATAIAFGAFVGTVIVGAAVFPRLSWDFWTRLAGGDSGINDGIPHYTNQSVMGSALRLFGDGAEGWALVVAGSLGLVGLAAAVLWQRLGHESLGLCLVAFAALVASPISWSHHYVWVLPLGLVLFLRGAELPRAVQISGWLLAGYVAAAPFKLLPHESEETWGTGLRLVNSTGLVLAIAFMIICLVVGWRRLRGGVPAAG